MTAERDSSRGARVAWFDDNDLLASLPTYIRAYAAYSRAAVDRQTGRVPGGSFLFGVLRRAVAAIRLTTVARASVSGREVFVDLTDPRVLWVFNELRGDSDEYRVLKTLLRAGDTFLDVGANHGSYAILAAELVGKSGRVVAIEPQPQLAHLIEQSLRAGDQAPFEVYQLAAGEVPGTAVLDVPRAGSGAASVHIPLEPKRRERSVAVSVQPLDQVLPWRDYPGSLVVKLDVEGSELACVRGARALLRSRRPAILFELNPETCRAAGASAFAVVSELVGLGYGTFAELAEYPLLRKHDALDLNRQRNVLALPDASQPDTVGA